MKRLWMACVFVVGSLLMVACGGSSSGGGGGGGNQNSSLTSGNWYVEATSTVTVGAGAFIGGNLLQNGSTITGTMQILSDCYDLLNSGVPFSGSVNGSSVVLTSGSVDGQVITVNATITNANTITGTYSIAGGCSAGDHGNITGTHVPSISGTWKATEVVGGTTITTSANITQGVARSDGTFALSGTVTFTNSSCAVTATIDGTNSMHFGDIVAVMATTNEAGGGHGDLFLVGLLDNPSTATTMTGLYSFDTGICAGTTNQLAFTKQ
jgi:hypothetical protein